MRIAEEKERTKSERFKQKYDNDILFKEKAQKFSKEIPKSTFERLVDKIEIDKKIRKESILHDRIE